MNLRLKSRYLFEFCDQSWVPAGARECLFETMEACNSGTRSFNGRVAEKAFQLAEESGFDTIVELGAGRAPITTQLAQHPGSAEMVLVPCDLFPNTAAYRALEAEYPGRVRPIYDVVDITRPQPRLDDSVLVLCGMFHHVPLELRSDVLRALSESRARVAIFEPLRRTVASLLMTCLAYFPALALPLLLWKRPGFLRRALWCWLLPIVPYMFVWDGWISCLRQWTASEFREALEQLPDSARDIQIEEGANSLTVIWTAGKLQVEASAAAHSQTS
ncbi:MAG: class I SAM-dependent methyltransferase [Pirellulaceae bacterium]